MNLCPLYTIYCFITPFMVVLTSSSGAPGWKANLGRGSNSEHTNTVCGRRGSRAPNTSFNMYIKSVPWVYPISLSPKWMSRYFGGWFWPRWWIRRPRSWHHRRSGVLSQWTEKPCLSRPRLVPYGLVAALSRAWLMITCPAIHTVFWVSET